MNFAGKRDAEIDTWIKNHEDRGATNSELYLGLLEERARRRQASQKLSLEQSLTHLKLTAIAQRFTTYGALASASDVSWSQARHQMNGAYGHLDTLLEICHARGLPLLTAICVNQENVKTGKLGEDALVGFAEAGKRLSIPFADAEAFHTQSVEECFVWGREQAIA